MGINSLAGHFFWNYRRRFYWYRGTHVQSSLLPEFALLFCSCLQCWVSGRGVTTSSLSCSSSWTDPTMRVTLWALMGIGKDCEVCHTNGPLTPFCVCSLCLLREVGQGIETLWVALCAFCVAYAVHGKTAAAASPGSTWRNMSARFVKRITHLDYRSPFLPLFTVWHMFRKCWPRDTCSLRPLQWNMSTVDLCSFALCVLFFFTWFAIILSGQETETIWAVEIPTNTVLRARCNELCLCSFFYRLKDGW